MSENAAEQTGSVDWDTTQSNDMLIGTVVLAGCFALVCLFMVASV